MIITDGRPKVVLVYITDSTSAIKGTGVPVASIKEDAGMGTTVSYYRAGMSLMMVGRAMLLVCHRARRSNGDLMIRGGHSMRVEEPKQ